MKQANDAVAIEQGNTDWDLESGSRDGGHKEYNQRARNRWNVVFIISCAIAIFIDPLYCYAPIINGKCLELHQRLMWTYIGLRSAIDVFYAIDLGIIWRSRRTRSNPVLSFKEETFYTRISQKTRVLYLILVSLPLPEGLLLSELLLYTWDPTYVLIMTTPIQYSLRIYHMYVFLRLRRRIKMSGILGKWLKAVMDYLPFVIASHSNVTSSTKAVQRMSQSFWWALRNLSSFGSNLQTSLYTMEIFLSVLISISGMALFLVYLNARVQEFKSKPLPSKPTT